MRQILKLAVLVLSVNIVTGCGGESASPDHTGGFTGTWSGTDTVATTQGLESANPGGFFVVGPPPQISARGLNELELAFSICPGLDPLPASVTSASSFTVGEFSCAPVGGADGCSLVLHVDRGTGTLANNSLNIEVTGTYTYCSAPYTFTYRFSGTRG